MLGPRLFLVFINDATQETNSNISLFADDAKCWRQIHSRADCVELQNDLDNLHQWSVRNSLPFNIQKCHVLSIHQKVTCDYQLDGTKLRHSQERDLGVIVQDNLGWTSHSKVAKKSFQRVGNSQTRIWKF